MAHIICTLCIITYRTHHLIITTNIYYCIIHSLHYHAPSLHIIPINRYSISFGSLAHASHPSAHRARRSIIQSMYYSSSDCVRWMRANHQCHQVALRSTSPPNHISTNGTNDPLLSPQHQPKSYVSFVILISCSSAAASPHPSYNIYLWCLLLLLIAIHLLWLCVWCGAHAIARSFALSPLFHF